VLKKGKGELVKKGEGVEVVKGGVRKKLLKCKSR